MSIAVLLLRRSHHHRKSGLGTYREHVAYRSSTPYRSTAAVTAGGFLSFTGTGTLTASAGSTFRPAASFTGSGVLAVAAVPRPATSVVLSGAGVLSTTSFFGQTILAGEGTLTVGGAPKPAGVATLTGSGQLTTTGGPGFTDAAAFSGEGTLGASGVGMSSSASFTGSGSLAALGQPQETGAASFTGSGSLAAAGVFHPALTGAASFTGSGSLAASGAVGLAGVTRSNRCDGPNGVPVSTANTGGPDQFDIVQTSGAGGGAVVFDASNPYKGTSSVKVTGGNTQQYAGWVDGAKTQWYGRVYYQYQSAVPAVFPIVRFVSGGVNGANIRFGNSGKLTLHTGSVSAADGTVGTDNGIWYRIEFAVTFSTSNGSMDAWLYQGDSATPMDHVSASGLALSATADEVDFGLCNNNVAGFSLWIDDLNINTSGPPGATA